MEREGRGVDGTAKLFGCIILIMAAAFLGASLAVPNEIGSGFCLGGFFASLSASILLLSYGAIVGANRGKTGRALGVASVAGAARAGAELAGMVGRGMCSVEVERHSSTRIDGALTVRNRRQSPLFVTALAAPRPPGCKVALRGPDTGDAAGAAGETVAFAGARDEIAPSIRVTDVEVVRFSVLLASEETDARRAEIEVEWRDGETDATVRRETVKVDVPPR